MKNVGLEHSQNPHPAFLFLNSPMSLAISQADIALYNTRFALEKTLCWVEYITNHIFVYNSLHVEGNRSDYTIRQQNASTLHIML